MMKAPLLLLLLLPLYALANTFVVTSNADSGPGTLRDALQQAANNGTGVADSITFNLGKTIAQRTISVKSLLPNLSSNLVIDGTTQPGAFFGLSNAKVIIMPSGGDNSVTKLSYCFKLDSVNNVGIYGLYFKGFCQFNAGGTVNQPAALVANDIANIIFGQPGKGNVIAGCSYGIAKFYFAGIGNNITIQSNFFGVDTTGVTKIFPAKTLTNVSGVQIYQASNILVGGSTLQEGNLFAANTTGAKFVEAGGTLNIGYNKFGTNPDETKYSYGSQAIQLASCAAKTVIHHNTFCGDGEFDSDTGHITITNNFFGINRYKTVKFTSSNAYSGVSFNTCLGGAMIGGNDTTLANIFAYGYTGVGNNNSKGVSILKNSFYCHDNYGIDFDTTYTLPNNPFIYVNSQTANNVSGTARPNSLVELFYNDSCNNCEGQYFVARVYADAAGKWSYTGNLTGGIVATATNNDDGTTSAFSKVIFDTTAIKITNSSCGKKDGSISGLAILSGTRFHWEDSTGHTVGTDTVLRNVPAGKYRFVCTMAFSGCWAATGFYTVTDVNPGIDTSGVKITNPFCGLFNGSVTNIKITSGQNLVTVWTDLQGNIISDSLDLKNAGNGTYKFTLTDTAGKCSVTAGPYKLVNQSGPTIITDSIQINGAYCKRADGSITKLSYTNATAPVYIAWQDSTGTVVSNTLSLVNVVAGRYRLVFKDKSTCDTIVSNYYTVPDAGEITIDTSQMVVTPTLCKAPVGAITGITAVNATTFNWVNAAAGDTVANTINISHLPAGIYRLLASNSHGCQAQTNIITVSQPAFLTDTVVKATISDASCNLNNGAVTINQFSRDSSLYTFQWVDTLTGKIVSKFASAQGFGPGYYALYATDTGGCRQQIFAAAIKQLGKPQFDDSSNITITHSSCGAKNGVISGLKIINATRFYWQDAAGNIVGTDTVLRKAAAGNYTFVCIVGSQGCQALSRVFTITDVNPALDTSNIVLTNPVCGQFNGSIVNMSVVSGQNLVFAWADPNGNIISDSLNLKNAGNGTYIFTLTDTSGKCSVKAGPYRLVNQSGPTLLTDSVVISRSYCGQADGSILNMGYKNSTGPVYTAWQDSAGNIITNALNLINVGPGRYRMVFKDSSGCDTIVTNFYRVADNGPVTIDTAQMAVTPSLCKGSTGGINGITTVNATVFRWINTATGDTVATTLNAAGIPPGNYVLLASDTHGCHAQSSAITVPQTGFLADSVLNVAVLNASCNVNNGAVTINRFSRDSSLYTFQWVDSTTNGVVSGYASVNGLARGSYKLFATDTAGCRQQIFAADIAQLGAPKFDYSNMQIINDTCSQKTGEVLFNTGNPNGYIWKGYNTAGQLQSVDSLGLINLAAGKYYATITDSNNCTVPSDTFTVGNYEFTPPAPQAANQAIVMTTKATIQVTNAIPGNYYLYDTVNATVPVNTSTTGVLVTPPVYYDKYFYIKYMEGDCASALTPVWITVYDSTLITVPNAFSPNGDGINDTWHLQVRGTVVEYNLTIFNRYGQAVYTSKDINKPWDGTVNGTPLPVGTYYYIIRAKDNAGKAASLNGYVVIVR